MTDPSARPLFSHRGVIAFSISAPREKRSDIVRICDLFRKSFVTNGLRTVALSVALCDDLYVLCDDSNALCDDRYVMTPMRYATIVKRHVTI